MSPLVLLVLVFIWGMGGGIAMSMSRTIMQEQAPEAQRSRVMSFYSFAFMGSGPIGALLNGFAAQWIGARGALALAAATMLAVVALIARRSGLWRLNLHASNAATAPSE